jgi:hypothetical protein
VAIPPDPGGGPAGVNVADVIAYAVKQLGKPYLWGANGPNAYDCSGLVQDAYGHFGISLPRTSQDQARTGTSVAKNQIQAGDLVFSDWGDGPNSHVGMATSAGRIIDAPHTGAVVRYDTLDANYLSHVTAVRRPSGTVGQGNVTGRGTAVAGGPGGGAGFFDPIIQPISDLAAAASEVGKVADLITKAFIPTNFVRIVSGILGAIFILLGIHMLSKEVRK